MIADEYHVSDWMFAPHVYHQQPTKECCGTHLVMLRIPDEKNP